MKDTLCWYCKNAYGGCPWSRSFEPVRNWQATPTKITYTTHTVDSFCVHKCPRFKADVPVVRPITIKRIGEMLGVSERTVHRMGEKKLTNRLLEIGYKLEIYKFERLNHYYISKI